MGADGVADDADALQQAINQAQEASGFGIVLIPEGRYRLGTTVHVWAGIRLIGYGPKRPVFVLGETTPGYQEGEGRYMVHFVSRRPTDGGAIRDATPGTFYSAISNVNFEIGEGNLAAIGIRSHFAQHCYIAHVDFDIGSGRAGIEEVGNEIDDCRFFGGDYGIITTKPSPSWPFLMIDSVFERQRTAAIRTEEGGLTLVRNHFKHVPSAIVVNPDRAEELWLTDSRFEDISGPAIVISDEFNARPQINLDNVVCDRVPVLAAFRKSGKKILGSSSIYQVKDFCHGQQLDDLGATPEIRTTFEIVPLDVAPAPVPSDIPALPAQETWADVTALGAKGDGVTDDTEVLKAAIANHRTLYLPTGRYRVTDSIVLKPDTVLVGLNPVASQIVLLDNTPAFQGEAGSDAPKDLPRWVRARPPLVSGAPKPLLEAPKGGSNIVTGIGLDTGGVNGCAVAAKWMAGANSMMNDVRFFGGHGTLNADGSRVPVYNDNRTADGNPKRGWDSQYWSLWITDGGGGTFKDIWTPSPYAQAGIYISNTSTEGRIYAMSVEHHVRNEVQLRNASNWRIYALQLEEESGEGPNALPVEIVNCNNITFANLYLYRVIRVVSPYPYGVKIASCHDLEFRGVHVYGPTKLSFDNTLYDMSSGAEVRSREIAKLIVSGRAPKARPIRPSPVLAPGACVKKVVGGFEFIDGAAADRAGNVYFVDGRRHRIYRWSPDLRTLSLVCDTPIAPLALAFDQAGNLLITARTDDFTCTTFALDTDGDASGLRVLPLAPTGSRDGGMAILPGHRWRDAHDFLAAATQPSDGVYLSPDGMTFIPKSDDLRRAFSLRVATPGQPFYLADEFGQKTWSFEVGADGTLSAPQLFAEEGELDVAVDDEGNVYVAAGEIFVYSPAGELIDTIAVPERPASLVFGGPDRKTLFITARSSLYSVRVQVPGRVQVLGRALLPDDQ